MREINPSSSTERHHDMNRNQCFSFLPPLPSPPPLLLKPACRCSSDGGTRRASTQIYVDIIAVIVSIIL